MRASRFLLWFFFICSAALLSAAEPLYHLLAKGETLFAVARIYGVSPEALVSANGISDPAKLKVGQKLLIPSTHRVGKGETLYGIAKSAGISVADLRALNKLGANAVIKVGDLLYLPSAAPASPAAPPAVQGTTTPGGQTENVAATQAQTVKVTPPPSTSVATGSPRAVSSKANLPCAGEARYLDGKLYGIAIKTAEGTETRAVAGGTVVSAGPYRGFGAVAFVQSNTGLIYVYGGNSSLDLRLGDTVRPGQVVGRVGRDPLGGVSEAYFFVFKGGEALDPALAPRG
jgi:murein DD-endopeptidase MepM/ murein hydrolase activator NlpD